MLKIASEASSKAANEPSKKECTDTLIELKKCVIKLREALKVGDALRQTILGQEKPEVALQVIRTFNKYKQVLDNCTSKNKAIDMSVFNGLMRELKTKIKIARLKADKNSRIYHDDSKCNAVKVNDISNNKEVEQELKKEKEIERDFMLELNLFRIDRIQSALSPQ